MSLVMDGKVLAKKISIEIKKEILKLKNKYNKTPTLATILVGEDPSSKMYVKMKQHACKKVGIKSVYFELKENTTTKKLIEVIENLNKDDSIDGILLQHPVPKHIDEAKCFDSISVLKDVDGVNSYNFGKISMGDEEAFLSATALAIKKIIEFYNIETEGKQALVIGRSRILGKPTAMMLLNKNATVTLSHSKTKNLEKLCKKADIVVACLGKAKHVKEKWLKKGAVVIDAGYNEGNVGDVDISKNSKKLKAYTPVPGGVGPMTISSLLEQTLKAFKQNQKLVNKK